jgi:hypothetical protein
MPRQPLGLAACAAIAALGLATVGVPGAGAPAAAAPDLTGTWNVPIPLGIPAADGSWDLTLAGSPLPLALEYDAKGRISGTAAWSGTTLEVSAKIKPGAGGPVLRVRSARKQPFKLSLTATIDLGAGTAAGSGTVSGPAAVDAAPLLGSLPPGSTDVALLTLDLVDGGGAALQGTASLTSPAGSEVAGIPVRGKRKPRGTGHALVLDARTVGASAKLKGFLDAEGAFEGTAKVSVSGFRRTVGLATRFSLASHCEGAEPGWDSRFGSVPLVGIGTGASLPLTAVAANAEYVYVGGTLQAAGGVAVSNVARFHKATRTWSAMGMGTDGRVWALAATPTGVYAAGEFQHAGGQLVNFVARWTDATGQWTPLTGVVETTSFTDTGLLNPFKPENDDVYVYAGNVATIYNRRMFAVGEDLYLPDAETRFSSRQPLLIWKADPGEWRGTCPGNLSWASCPGPVKWIEPFLVRGTDIIGHAYSGSQITATAQPGAWIYDTVDRRFRMGPVHFNGEPEGMAVEGTKWFVAGAPTAACTGSPPFYGATGRVCSAWTTAQGLAGQSMPVSGAFLFDEADGSVTDLDLRLDIAGSRIAPGLVDLLDGRPVVTGAVLKLNEEATAYLEFLVHDGTSWTSAFGFPTGFPLVVDTRLHRIRALARDKEGLIVAGGFGDATGLARWDGHCWSQFLTGDGKGLTGGVRGMAVAGGRVHVVGTGQPGIVDAIPVALWDGSDWSALHPCSRYEGLPTVCDAVAVDGTTVYVGGSFTGKGDVGANNVARWTGSAWDAMGGGTDGAVHAIAAGPGFAYAGGAFSKAGGIAAGNVALWDGSAWSPLGAGTNGEVRALALATNGDLYVGGSFSAATGIAVSNVARWNATEGWRPLGAGVNGAVSALVIDDRGDLYAAGSFGAAGTAAAARVARWNGVAWSGVGTGISSISGTPTVDCLAYGSGYLYAGGSFQHGTGLEVLNNVARWDGTSWTGLAGNSGNGVSGRVRAIVPFACGVYLGGDFAVASGTPSRFFACWRE